MLRCGLIVNPVAGVGGEAGLKGSDGVEVQRLAFARGARSRAASRAVRALTHARSLLGDVVWLTGAGALGEEAATTAGFAPTVVYTPPAARTSAKDTRALAGRLVEAGVDIILFVGGDGTARDVCAAVGTDQLVLGVPSGVKMHSGVFAITPEDAAAVLQLVAAGRAVTTEAEVVDLDEDARRAGRLESTLYGVMRVPSSDRNVQRGKRRTELRGAPAVAGIAAEVADRLDPEGACLFGPGTTIRNVGEALGWELSLLGVDVVQDGRVTGRDLDSDRLNELVSGRRLQIVVSPIGGQGIVLGRGNQQLDRRILERLHPDDLIVVATVEKLGSLVGSPLHLDAPTVDLNRKFAGFTRVVVGYRQEAVVRIR